MKMSQIYKLIVIFLFCSSGLFAQQDTCCFYRLELTADFGFTWNNSFLRVTIGDVTTNYTLDFDNSDGAFLAENLLVSNGDSIKLEYVEVGFDGDAGYALYDSEGNIAFSDGPDPIPGEVYADVINCPDCPDEISDLYVNIEDIRAMRADINLLDCVAGSTYIIEYDTIGFMQGMTENVLNTAGGDVSLTGLQEKTLYDFYVALVCATGDTSEFIGPFTFETIYKVDVGIVDVSSPLTACGLTTAEEITVTLQNFGANPQTLIPFFFSVNGVVAGVSQPFDGYFTGVLGKDSTFTLPFETTFDLSAPGEYVIAAWTEFENDSDIENDTAYWTVINIPIVTEYPYFQDFEEWNGGWTVGEDSNEPSWAFGAPNSAIISGAASGNNAWVTNLEGTYNNVEVSYLVSPCLDFSNLTEDPLLSFSLQVETESCCDEGWVEMSLDGGEEWTKVGATGTGVNWYNDGFGDYWNGDGGFAGWVTAVNLLEGSAGESDVKVRFVFQSDFSVVDEGFGIDDVFISPPLDNDLVGLSASHTSELDCGEENDMIMLNIRNLGNQTQTGFDVAYAVNGETPVVENVGALSIAPGQEAAYTFTTPFNSSGLGSYDVVAWTDLAGEQFAINDTTSFSFATAISLPFIETFESGVLPENWQTPGEIAPVGIGHSAPSNVLFDNLWSSDGFFEAITPVVGLVETGDSLTFEYRYVNFTGGGEIPTVLGTGDSLLVAISTDCGETYENVLKIDNTNHVPTNLMQMQTIYLEDYVGEAIRIRFSAYWAEGDYYLDLDNIGVVRCPVSLDLATDSSNATTESAPDGTASVSPGTGLEPFTYQWSSGDIERTATGLTTGTYTVTVTDAGGCTDVAEVTVDFGVNVEEIERLTSIQLIPNPAREQTRLELQFTEAVNVQVQVVNMVGQVMFHQRASRVQELNYNLDLNNYSEGMYFVRVLVGNQVHTKKLIHIK